MNLNLKLDNYGYSNEPGFLEWCLGQVVMALKTEEDAMRAKVAAEYKLDFNDPAVDGHLRETKLSVLLATCRLELIGLGIVDDSQQVGATLYAPFKAADYLNTAQYVFTFGWTDDHYEAVDCADDPQRNDERNFPIHYPDRDNIRRGIGNVLGNRIFLKWLNIKSDPVGLSKHWRDDFLDAYLHGPATNQGLSRSAPRELQYENLNFNSRTELRIAKELDKASVMYFANCMCRVNRGPADRVNREPDFLICHNGKWGILEVDGQDYHTSAAKDHDRDRLFQHHGIRFCQHYDATRCYQEPSQVVAEFLDLLARVG